MFNGNQVLLINQQQHIDILNADLLLENGEVLLFVRYKPLLIELNFLLSVAFLELQYLNVADELEDGGHCLPEVLQQPEVQVELIDLVFLVYLDLVDLFDFEFVAHGYDLLHLKGPALELVVLLDVVQADALLTTFGLHRLHLLLLSFLILLCDVGLCETWIVILLGRP